MVGFDGDCLPTPHDPFIDENGVVFNVIHEIVGLHMVV
jgi:hypothetical protein